MSTRHLLIVYHTQSGNTGRLAEAAWRGATDDEVTDVEVRMVRASDAGPDDLLWTDALLLGTPENFGYMSGGMKDFLDRTFYPVEGKIQALPYAIFISAGNDGTGAIRAIHRIATAVRSTRCRNRSSRRGRRRRNTWRSAGSSGWRWRSGSRRGSSDGVNPARSRDPTPTGRP